MSKPALFPIFPRLTRNSTGDGEALMEQWSLLTENWGVFGFAFVCVSQVKANRIYLSLNLQMRDLHSNCI